jgi:ABC-type antimicrobial peptide transport system permease subunit
VIPGNTHLFQDLALTIIAALLAGVYPALKMARTSPAEALQTENTHGPYPEFP